MLNTNLLNDYLKAQPGLGKQIVNYAKFGIYYGDQSTLAAMLDLELVENVNYRMEAARYIEKREGMS